jgi:serine/threonine-protein kinase
VPPDAQFCPRCGAVLDGATPVPVTGRLAPQSLLHNRYLILQKLAQGGQSAVYHALDTLQGGADRAIKEMSESDLTPIEREKAINGFMREARMLSTLQHPALAKVYEVFIEEHKHYLVMEYVAGHNLEDELMKAGRPLDWERVTRWGVALCDLFTYLHAEQPPIIYRDLKPPNVMLLADGSIKLIDFGIARWFYPDRQDTAQLGTDGYAPPEQ